MFALYGGGGRGASCVWLLAALVALHVSASAQSEVVPCGYNIQGDDCAKAKSEGSWGLNEGKKQDQVSTTTPMTWLAAVGTFIFLLFGLRVLYIIRLRQQLLHRGGS